MSYPVDFQSFQVLQPKNLYTGDLNTSSLDEFFHNTITPTKRDYRTSLAVRSDQQETTRNNIIEYYNGPFDSTLLYHIMTTRLYQQLMNKGGIYSPLSTYQLLYLVLLGSDNTTKQELSKFLYNTTNPNTNLWITCPDMQINNAIFCKNPKYLRTNYVKALSKWLDRPEGFSVDCINQWVKDKTHGLIPSIINELPANSIIVLVNTIYFKSNWLYKFPKSNTYTAGFNQHLNNNISVKMMSQCNTFRYSSTNSYQKVELPYATGNLLFGVILPNSLDIDNINLIEAISSPCNLIKIELHLPKFIQESSYDLKAQMNTTVPSLFNTNCDLSKMCHIDLQNPIYVSSIIQKAKIIVDEDGTEACAATVACVKNFCSMSKEPEIPKMIVNRNFIYYIKYVNDKNSHVVFIGRGL